jgi:hypothetical protein
MSSQRLLTGQQRAELGFSRGEGGTEPGGIYLMSLVNFDTIVLGFP